MRALDLVATWPVGSAAAGALARAPRGPRHDGPCQVVPLGSAGETGSRFEWASVTKLCTALAVLVAVEERTVSLDEPAGPPGSSVAHLLAHASGLAPDAREALCAPGTRRIYSSSGFELLAEVLEARAKIPFGVYLAEAVFGPLGMGGAVLPAGASPAFGIEGSLDDLLALGRELLEPTVVSRATLEEATAVAFPGLAGVLPGYGFQNPCDWGLGFELRDAKRPHWTGSRCSASTFGHFGRSGSFLWVDPVAGVACAAVCDRAWGSWTQRAWPSFGDAVLETAARG